MIKTGRREALSFALAENTPPPLHDFATLEALAWLVYEVKVGLVLVLAMDTVATPMFLW